MERAPPGSVLSFRLFLRSPFSPSAFNSFPSFSSHRYSPSKQACFRTIELRLTKEDGKMSNLKLSGLLVAILLFFSVFAPNIASAELRQEFVTNLVWQWDNNTESMLEALSYIGDGYLPQALDSLKDGQKENPHVIQVYETAYNNLKDFSHLVATASSAEPNFYLAEKNIGWQYSNNLISLDDANKEWGKGNKIRALHRLLLGQKHTITVMNLYRACYRADADKLFRIAQDMIEK